MPHWWQLHAQHAQHARTARTHSTHPLHACTARMHSTHAQHTCTERMHSTNAQHACAAPMNRTDAQRCNHSSVVVSSQQRGGVITAAWRCHHSSVVVSAPPVVVVLTRHRTNRSWAEHATTLEPSSSSAEGQIHKNRLHFLTFEVFINMYCLSISGHQCLLGRLS